MSAPRRCRTAAAGFWRRSACGPELSNRRRRRSARFTCPTRAASALRASTPPNRAWPRWATSFPTERSGRALWSRLRLSVSNVQVYLSRARCRAISRMADACVALQVAKPAPRCSVDARLVVAADGVQSAVRGAFGVERRAATIEQTAVITTVLPQRFHDHVAYERFTDSGPLALLPLDGRPMHAGADLETDVRRECSHGVVGCGVPRRTAATIRISPRPLPQGRAAVLPYPLVADAAPSAPARGAA